jgi:hypothetical protein
VGYIPVPVETEPTDLAEDAFGYLEDKIPGWLPSPGNLEAWLIESLAQIAGELRTLAALVPDSIFQFYGESVLGLAPFEATAATGFTTWTAIDPAGYTVDAGTLVALSPPASLDSHAFEVVAEFTIAPGDTVAAAVEIRAVEPGAAANGITGAVEMLDPLDFIASVTLTGPTSGGVDAETSEEYLDRLSDLLTTLSPRPILPQDFAIIAQREIPGIARCTPIDLYNADTGQTDVPRCCTVVPIDEAGNPVPAETKNQIDALLESMREVNFLVFVADPTYTPVDVTFQVSAYSGWDAADVAARVTDALTSYLSPENWGVPPFGDTSARSWINDTDVRYLELAEVINRVDGVHHVVTLTFAQAGQPQATADITLPGVAPLPNPGTITGTAVIET